MDKKIISQKGLLKHLAHLLPSSAASSSAASSSAATSSSFSSSVCMAVSDNWGTRNLRVPWSLLRRISVVPYAP